MSSGGGQNNARQIGKPLSPRCDPEATGRSGAGATAFRGTQAVEGNSPYQKSRFNGTLALDIFGGFIPRSLSWTVSPSNGSDLVSRREEFPRRGRRGSREPQAGARATPPAGLNCPGARSGDLYFPNSTIVPSAFGTPPFFSRLMAKATAWATGWAGLKGRTIRPSAPTWKTPPSTGFG